MEKGTGINMGNCSFLSSGKLLKILYTSIFIKWIRAVLFLLLILRPYIKIVDSILQRYRWLCEGNFRKDQFLFQLFKPNLDFLWNWWCSSQHLRSIRQTRTCIRFFFLLFWKCHYVRMAATLKNFKIYYTRKLRT